MPSQDLVFRFLGVDAGASREFDRMAGKSASLQKAFGGLAVGLAAGAAGIAVESVKMASKFQQQMTVIETQAGRSAATVDRWSKAVLNLAGPTATAPDTLAAGLYHLASTGMKTADTMKALKVAAEGAKLGNANLEDVTNALNATIVSGIKGSSDFTSAMGALNATVGAGDMRMQDLAEAMGTGVLTTAKNFGVSLNSVGAALAVLGDNGIRGADAATKLSQAITYLEKPAKGADKVLQSIGLSSKQLRTDMGSGGLGKTLADLHDHLVAAGDSGTKMGPILLDAFGRKPANAINTLLGEYQRFQQKQDEVAKGSKNFASDWTAYTKTFGYSWDRARSAFQSMLISLGDELLPTATKAMNWIGTKGVADLDKFGSWVSRNKTPIEDIAKALAAIAAFRFATSSLSSLSRLLGVGTKSLAGGLGVLGSAKPIPVYVTNPGWGKGLPGGDGKEPVPAPKVPLTKVLPGLGTLALAYGATQGGDVPDNLKQLMALQAQGVAHGPYKGAALNMRAAAAALKQILGGSAAGFITQSQGHGYQAPVLHTTDAVAQILSGGSAAQVKSLKELAKQYPELQKDIDAFTKSESNLNKLLVLNTGLAKNNAAEQKQLAAITAQQQKVAVDNVIAQLKRIPGAYAAAAAEAKAGGLTIGEQLDAGLTVAIQQNAGKVNIVTKAMVDGVLQTASRAAALGSPSKKTYYIGEMLVDGLALALGEKSAKAVAAMQSLADKTLSKLDTLKGQASGLYNGIVGNLEGGAGFGSAPTTDSFGSPMAPTFAGVLSFKQDYLKRETAFARNLALLRKKGLQPGDVAQIAQLGLDQGGPLAQSLAGASAKQLHQLSAIDNAIAAKSRSIGAGVENAVYGRQEAKLVKEQKESNELLTLVTQLLKRKTRLDDSTLRELAHLLAKLHISVSLTEQNRKNGQKIIVATL